MGPNYNDIPITGFDNVIYMASGECLATDGSDIFADDEKYVTIPAINKDICIGFETRIPDSVFAKVDEYLKQFTVITGPISKLLSYVNDPLDLVGVPINYEGETIGKIESVDLQNDTWIGKIDSNHLDKYKEFARYMVGDISICSIIGGNKNEQTV